MWYILSIIKLANLVNKSINATTQQIERDIPGLSFSNNINNFCLHWFFATHYSHLLSIVCIYKSINSIQQVHTYRPAEMMSRLL